MGLGSNISQKVLTKAAQSEPLTKIKPLEWERKKVDPNAKYGKNIALIGQPMAGKTNLLLQHGFFNSAFIPHMKEAGFHDVVELLKSGLLPEIEKIVIIESENNLLKALNDGVEKALYRPLRDIIDIIPIVIPRKNVVLKGGKLVSVNREILSQVREKYKETIKALVDDEPETTLLGVDSGTKYKKLLDDKIGTFVDTIEERKNASLEGLDKYTMIAYAHRNTEWEEVMEYVRGFKGWNIDTFKESKTPDFVLKADPTKDALNTKWVNGTEHFLDIVWRITGLPDGSRRVEIVDGQSRYLPSKTEKLKPFKIPTNSRMAAMPLISRMTEKLMLGETKDDEQFWGV